MELVHALLAAVFWACFGLVAYTYLVYPLLIWVLARLFHRPSAPPVPGDADLPTLSVLVAAYNEEAEIDKLLNAALRLDYPKDRLEIVIASDGSSDATPAIVRRYAGRGVRLLDYQERRGKAAVLNSAFAELKGDVVLLSDANVHIDPPAPRRLVRWFRDPQVGIVCGKLILTDPETGQNVDGLYWKYETFLKKCEGRLGALLGANGALYAVRREVHAPIPTDTLVDDFYLPLQCRLRSGCAIVFDAEATAHEETPARIGSEYHRRSRIGAGGFQSIARLWKLLDPRQGWVAFTFFSHKVLRWLGPFFLLGMLVSNLALATEPLYQVLLAGQVGFYFLSWLALHVPPWWRPLRPLRLTTMFTVMNLALLAGFWRWLRGGQKGTWKRTARLREATSPIRAQ